MRSVLKYSENDIKVIFILYQNLCVRLWPLVSICFYEVECTKVGAYLYSLHVINGLTPFMEWPFLYFWTNFLTWSLPCQLRTSFTCLLKCHFLEYHFPSIFVSSIERSFLQRTVLFCFKLANLALFCFRAVGLNLPNGS